MCKNDGPCQPHLGSATLLVPFRTSAFSAPLAPARCHVFFSIFAKISSIFIRINLQSLPTFSLLSSPSCFRPSLHARAPPGSPPGHLHDACCCSLQRKPAQPPAGTAGPRRRGTRCGKVRPSCAKSEIRWGKLLSSEPANAAAVVLTKVFLTGKENKPEVSEKRVYQVSRKIIGFAILISDEI